ncbi:MAG: sulfatase [Planctomycetes bacterium]|nr:sulfatase [Planctomycetota bacterium]
MANCRIGAIAVGLAIFTLYAGTAHADAPKKKQPNIIFLLADDLRWNAVGFMGDKLAKTPNLDKLAKRGVVFRNHFVTTSICAVSRASIFAGQYARRHKINDFVTDFTPEAWARTYPMLLKRAGYRIGFIGKFGVGAKMQAASFDFWKGFPGQGAYFGKGETVHLTHRMGDQALEFLQGCKKDQPFCLSLSFKCPHAMDAAKREYPPDPRDENLFKDVTFPIPKTADPKFFQALPDFVQKSESRKRWERRFKTPEKFQEIVRDYYRLVTGMDREIGRILDELDRLGIADDTIILFTSDNGYFFGERGLADKWYLYEESVRVPMLVFDPSLPKERRNRTVDAMTLNIDLAPTMLDYAGVAIPESMQGKSLRPWVRGESPKWRDDWFYEHHTAIKIIPESEGVRTNRWTYLRWMKDASKPVEELYDLQTDPWQERNLVAGAAHQDTLRHLRSRWETLRKELE